MAGKHDKRRIALERKYNRSYAFKDHGDRMRCAYCGDTRECTDHIPPLAIVEDYGLKNLRDREIELQIIPCCAPCNMALGVKALFTYEERLIFLYNNLLDKAEKRIVWSKEELEELGGELKRMVREKQRQIHRETTLRLRGMEASIGKLNIDE